MNWQEVCEHPDLQNLPFKIELNEYGNITMSPVKVYHSAFQGEIEYLLRLIMKTGKTLPECAIKTRKGTKVADVAWISLEKFFQVKHEVECSIAPEICVEVLSSSNFLEEMEEKQQLYFEQGAIEVWICDEEGHIQFHDKTGHREQSDIAIGFPSKINL
jgi:Uma2 family endonuclease